MIMTGQRASEMKRCSRNEGESQREVMNEDMANKELVFHMNESGLCVRLENGGVRSFPAQTTRCVSFSQHWEKSQEERRLNCLTLVKYKSDNDSLGLQLLECCKNDI